MDPGAEPPGPTTVWASLASWGLRPGAVGSRTRALWATPPWSRKTRTCPLGLTVMGPLLQTIHCPFLPPLTACPQLATPNTRAHLHGSVRGFSNSTDTGGPEMSETAEPRHSASWPGERSKAVSTGVTWLSVLCPQPPHCTEPPETLPIRPQYPRLNGDRLGR